MQDPSLAKAKEHALWVTRFKKTPQEKEDSKRAKSEWKKAHPKKK
jgi:hypothetical protein